MGVGVFHLVGQGSAVEEEVFDAAREVDVPNQARLPGGHSTNVKLLKSVWGGDKIDRWINEK